MRAFSPVDPKAVAIVHPALEERYPNQDSSGAMVAFKLAWAVANEFNAGTKLEPGLREFMINATSLTAMGTIADIVELCGENRVLTSFGLKALPQCELPGIQALIETAGLTGQGLDSFDIGFRLAPMLNAAGRMGHARLAVELLTSDSAIRSMKIAEYLKGQNRQRQQCERKIFAGLRNDNRIWPEPPRQKKHRPCKQRLARWRIRHCSFQNCGEIPSSDDYD